MQDQNFAHTLTRLVPHYVDAAPRYTSYPTAVEFKSDFSTEAWLSALTDSSKREPGAKRRLALYFHLPFCQTLCYFCACHKVITRDYSVVEPYLNALFRELDAYAALVADNSIVEQIHWGGGTPNFFSPQDMARLMEHTRRSFPHLHPDVEISVEVDPRTVTVEHLKTLKELGFTRLSLGVQDFRDEVQEAINRMQPYAVTKELVDNARRLGFTGINIDLIYGLPNQTVTGFLETIEQVLFLRPDRVALYGYAHVTWLKKVQKALERSQLPTPDQRVEIFTAAVSRFTAVGYEHIGMDHFALADDMLAQARRDGTLRRNFMGYTTHSGTEIIGFGASAISTTSDAFAQNVKDLPQYLEQIGASGFATERGLSRSRDDIIRAAVIEDILCAGAIDFQDFNRRWDIEVKSYFTKELNALAAFEADELIVCDELGVTLTEVGRIFARNIAAVFDVYLKMHREKATPVFSQTV